MTVGILLPLSAAHPGIARDFLDGFNSVIGDKLLTENISIKKENVGFGGTEKEVYAAAEKLLVSEDVDILVAYIDEKVTGMLYSLVQSTGKLMLIVNPGANYPLNWIAQQTVVHLNLQHAFLCRLTGALAAGAAKKNAAYASSFYDCGYLQSSAMVKNFTESGGTILHNYINNQLYNDDFEINQLIDYLTFNPDCTNIICVYDEQPASLFYKRLNVHNGQQHLHLFVSPMMLTEKAMPIPEEGFNFHVDGYLPWQPGLDTETNRKFTGTCTRPASIFSLLGWETALVIAEIQQQVKDDFSNGEKIVNHLKKTRLAGPRGELKLDPETLYYTAPAGRFTLEAGSTVPVVEWLTNLEEEWKSFTSINTEGAVTGWTNTYLCY